MQYLSCRAKADAAALAQTRADEEELAMRKASDAALKAQQQEESRLRELLEKKKRNLPIEPGMEDPNSVNIMVSEGLLTGLD